MDRLTQDEVVLLGIEMRRERRKVDNDCQRLPQWGTTRATPTRDEVKASSPYRDRLAQGMERIVEVDETLVL